jgi:hypothetical protein
MGYITGINAVLVVSNIIIYNGILLHYPSCSDENLKALKHSYL